MSEKQEDRPILVPVDFSPHAEAALLHAIDLAHCLGRPLLVLHIVHDPEEMPGYYAEALKKKQLRRIEDGAAAMLEEFLTRVVKQHPEAKDLRHVESLLVKGLPATRILEVAANKNAALIVLGSKGKTGVKRLLLGSVAERVVHLASVPVTVVKATK